MAPAMGHPSVCLPDQKERVDMATSTGKAARKSHGTRVGCKRARRRRVARKVFGKLPVSASRGNAAAFVAASGTREGAPDGTA